MSAQGKFKHLLSPLKMGDLVLKNRVILASMTRNRNLVPQQINVEYYTQRANAGLLLTEGTLVSQQGTEWPEAPGIYNEEQVAGWKKSSSQFTQTVESSSFRHNPSFSV